MFVEIKLFGEERTGIFDEIGVGDTVHENAGGVVFGFGAVGAQVEKAFVDFVNCVEIRKT